MLDQTPVQIACVTRDLPATEAALTSLAGAKKWVRLSGVQLGPETCSNRGRPADFVADISISYAGDTQIGTRRSGCSRSVYTDFLDRCGPGLHHICIEAADTETFDAAVSDAERDGAPVPTSRSPTFRQKSKHSSNT